MLFDSIEFIIFLPVVVILYFLLPAKIRKIFLLLASYFFYMQWNQKYLILILISTVLTYLSAILMKKKGERAPKIRKIYLTLAIVINLFILAIFKYYGFFVLGLNSILGQLNIMQVPKSLDLLLPVGISFYTFQALGYSIDVYRGDIEPRKNFIDYALFVSFFPQLVAGPIERSKNLLTQIENGSKFKLKNLSQGMFMIFLGLFFKLVIADRIAVPVESIFNNYSEYSGLVVFVGAALFSFQLYCDFNSYSIIAKGSAKILGYELMDNFRQPFFADSIKELWKRWHVSLSTWFKDYVYISLGGNKVSLAGVCINTMIVFLISGLWHGANIKFVIWGGFHGVLLVLFILRNRIFSEKTNGFINNSIVLKPFKIALTFTLFTISMFFFRADSFSVALSMIKRVLFSFNGNLDIATSLANAGLNRENLYVLLAGLFVLFIYDLLKEKWDDLFAIYTEIPFLIRYIVLMTLFFAVLVFGVYGPGFSETQFIYFQF